MEGSGFEAESWAFDNDVEGRVVEDEAGIPTSGADGEKPDAESEGEMDGVLDGDSSRRWGRRGGSSPVSADGLSNGPYEDRFVGAASSQNGETSLSDVS